MRYDIQQTIHRKLGRLARAAHSADMDISNAGMIHVLHIWITLIVIGICLMLFYAAWAFRIAGRQDSDEEDDARSLLGGWASGVSFVAGGAAMLSPDHWTYVVAAASLLIIAWFPFCRFFET